MRRLSGFVSRIVIRYFLRRFVAKDSYLVKRALLDLIGAKESFTDENRLTLDTVHSMMIDGAIAILSEATLSLKAHKQQQAQNEAGTLLRSQINVLMQPLQMLQGMERFFTRLIAIILLAGLITLGLYASYLLQGNWLGDTLLNLSTEIAGVGFTLLAVQYLWTRFNQQQSEQHLSRRQAVERVFDETNKLLLSRAEELETQIRAYVNSRQAEQTQAGE